MRSYAFVALLAGYAAAQAPPAPSPVAGATTHTVIVGGVSPPADATSSPKPQFYFLPESITANVGDTVTFVMMQANHSVTQSTFKQPCKALSGGIDSGFLANPSGDAGITFSMQVPTTDPLWFYCKQRTGSHCGKGMVFSVNPKAGVADGSHPMFKQQAIQQNGTGLQQAGIQAQPPPAVASTITLAAQPATPTQGGAGGAGGESAPGVPGAAATIAPGQGLTPQGQACSCSCLCGVGSFPNNVGQGAFGGFQGMISS